MSFQVLENQMKSIIKTLDAGTEFYLKDIINDPPSRLGVTLYQGVADGSIPDVTFIGKVEGCDKYRKN